MSVLSAGEHLDLDAGWIRKQITLSLRPVFPDPSLAPPLPAPYRCWVGENKRAMGGMEPLLPSERCVSRGPLLEAADLRVLSPTEAASLRGRAFAPLHGRAPFTSEAESR